MAKHRRAVAYVSLPPVRTTAVALLAAACVLATACGGGSTSPSAASSSGTATLPSQQADTANISGDIPDNQTYVTYTSSSGGYALVAPQGWARSVSNTNVEFTDKFNTVRVDVTTVASAPTVASAKANVATLSGAQIVEAKTVDVNRTQVIRVRYRSDSPPDSVTGKTLKLETDRYVFYRSGKQATLSLSAPVGADNVDPWNQIARSFKWN